MRRRSASDGVRTFNGLRLVEASMSVLLVAAVGVDWAVLAGAPVLHRLRVVGRCGFFAVALALVGGDGLVQCDAFNSPQGFHYPTLDARGAGRAVAVGQDQADGCAAHADALTGLGFIAGGNFGGKQAHEQRYVLAPGSKVDLVHWVTC
nr:MAG TPA: hypothetical protein [Caudoviricetes sp.]